MLDNNTAKLLVNMKYEDKGIKGVIELIDSIPKSIGTISTNCDDQAWINYIGDLSAKLILLDALIMTKRLQNQREDLKEIGNYLQKLGKEITEYKHLLESEKD